MRLRLAGLGLLVACAPGTSQVDLPVAEGDVAGLLVLGEQVHALHFEDRELVGDPVRVDVDALPERSFFYAYDRPLDELGLQAGLLDVDPDGQHLLPTPARSLQSPTDDVAWTELPERWQGPVTSLRIEAPPGCFTRVDSVRRLGDPGDPPIFAVALGPEGGWEETAVLVSLDSGALFLVTNEEIRSVEQPEASIVACGAQCRIAPVFRGFGNTLWFSYRDTNPTELQSSLRRASLDLERAVFDSNEVILRSAFVFPANELDGPRRTPVDQLDVFTARFRPERQAFVGLLDRYTTRDEPALLTRPFSLEAATDPNDPRHADLDLAFVSPEHTAVLWAFDPEDNVAYSAYSLQARAATSSVAQIAHVPGLGLVLGEKTGALALHPTELGAAPTPLPSEMTSEVLALEAVAGGFVAVERGALWHHRIGSDGTTRVCPAVPIEAEASVFVAEVTGEVVVVSVVGDEATVEWLGAREGP